MNITYQTRIFASNLLYRVDTFLGRNKTVKVLCFHGFGDYSDRYSISIKKLEQHILKLKKDVDFVGLSEIEDALNGKKYNKTKVLFTVDDGFKNAMNVAPLLKKHKIPVVLFVLSDPKRADRKQLHNNEPLLSWKEIKYLQTKGWIIGSHSATHTSFQNLNKRKIVQEIFDSKSSIEKHIRGKVVAFAYPRGVLSKTTTKAVKEAGYSYGFSIEADNVTKKTNRYIIPRTIIDGTHETKELPAVFTTSWFQLRRLTNRFGLWEKLLK